MQIVPYSGHIEVQKDGDCVAMLNFGDSGGYPDEQAAKDAAKFLIHGLALLAALKETVEKYGEPGGPWNIPSEPGEWISNARKLVKIFENGKK